MKNHLVIISLFSLLSFTLKAQIIHIPADHSSIQTGINAAADGDTVLVAEGTYYENIRFMGKAIMVASEFMLDRDTSHIENTIINGSQATDPDSAAVVMFVHGEDTTSILNGFTITDGSGVITMTQHNIVARAGGGVYSWNSGCKILNNIITNNHIEHEELTGGGGIQCGKDYGIFWTIIENNKIVFNTSVAYGYSAVGGGIQTQTNVIIRNNLIEQNTCTNINGPADGGGMEIQNLSGDDGSAIISNNMIRKNRIDGRSILLGGGVFLMDFQRGTEITNNIIELNIINAVEEAWGAGIGILNTSETSVKNNLIQYNSLNGNYTEGGACSFLCNWLRLNAISDARFSTP